MPPAPDAPLDIDALLRSVDARLQIEQTVPSNGNGSHPTETARLDMPSPDDLIKSILGQTTEVVEVPEEAEEEVGEEVEAVVEPEFVPPPWPAMPDSAPPKRKTNPLTSPSTRAPKVDKPKPAASRPGYTGRVTKRDVDPEEDIIRLYMKDIGKHPLLTKDDEVRLAQAYEKGRVARVTMTDPEFADLPPDQKQELRRQVREGDEAAQQFIKSNLRLVVSIAKHHQGKGLPLLDLVQEGNLGLMHAVDMFEWRKGFKFSTYATWWIRQAITRGAANTARTIRLPVHAVDSVNRLRRARHELELELGAGQEITVAMLADKLDTNEEGIKKILSAANTTHPLSFDQKLKDEVGSDTLGDVVADPESMVEYDKAARDADLTAGIAEALSSLDERERRIIKLRYLGPEPLTLEQVGEEFNLTRERIRQIESRGLTKLRHPSNHNKVGALALYLHGD